MSIKANDGQIKEILSKVKEFAYKENGSLSDEDFKMVIKEIKNKKN